MSAVPRPIRLVYMDEQGMFHMDSEAASILKLLKGPIAVVSVCGPSQEGKSFLLNQLLGRLSGFELAASFFSKGTEGLWMWSTPKRQIADDGTEYNVFVIDTQGIDSSTPGENYFYLAVVLSSLLIYNQFGHTGSRSFGCISLLDNVINMITAGGTTASDLQKSSPVFVWLLRDSYTSLMNGMSPSDYMEDALKPEPVPKRDADARAANATNKVTNFIKALFTDRYCFRLMRPWTHLSNSCSLDEVPDVCEEFKKEMVEVRSFVFYNTKPKKIGTTVITGPKFVQITRYILEAFNRGDMPTIACIREELEKTKRPKALDSATMAAVVGSPPAANTRNRKRSIQQRMSSQELANIYE